MDYSKNLEALYKIAVELDPNLSVASSFSLTVTIKEIYKVKVEKSVDYNDKTDVVKYIA